MKQHALSVIIPVYNEAPALNELYDRIARIAPRFGSVEMVFVDDCSRDGSFSKLRALAEKDDRVKVIAFARNAGQTAAIRAGMDAASGDIIIPIDSDLENDPADIPHLVEKIDEGYDVVSGWRQSRWGGSYLARRLPSELANWLISKSTGVHLHDYGCTLKAYRAEVIQHVPLYGQMHRFIPAYAAWEGAKVTEIPVRHEQRKHGTSNYGISRTFRVLLDLFLIRFLDRYMDRPIHFFGGWGFVLFFLGLLSGSVAVALRLFWGLHFVQTPLPTLTVFLILMGVNLIMLGIIAEVLMRTYYEVNDRKPYRIRETLNLATRR